MGHRMLSRTVAAIAASILGVAVGGGPARAEVTVTPDRVEQGAAAKLTFRVTEDRAPAWTTRIELRMPESTPVAEIYPMSVPDWAPRITMRTTDRPLDGLHHGQTTEVVGSITWTRAGRGSRPGAPAELTISLGPMPRVDRMTFTVIQTYSDGVVTNWDQPPSDAAPRPERPAPVLTLLPPAPAATGPGDIGGPPAAGAEQPDAAEPMSSLVVGLSAGLIGGLAGAALIVLRRRRTATEPADDDHRATPGTDLESGPGAAARGSGTTNPGRAWRLRE